MPIPEAELAAKRDLVKKGQSHRKFRKDPADHSTDGPDKPTRRHRVTGLKMQPSVPRRAAESHDTEERHATGSTMRSGIMRRKREQPVAEETAASPSDIRSVVRRPRSPSERRVTSCTVDLDAVRYAPPPSRASRRTLAAAPPENFGEWYTPEATHVLESGTAADAESTEQPTRSSSEGERPPPAKAQRPEGMPEATDGVGTYRPAPVEDDKLIAADDGMGTGPAPEIEVDLELEYEDLNVDSNTWDVRTDSPEPHVSLIHI